MTHRNTTKTLVTTIDPHVRVYRDATGIAWAENGHTGMGHSVHPNISATGSVSGMRRRGLWGKDDRVVRSRGYLYNVSECIVSDPIDAIVLQHCQCGGNHDIYTPNC